MYKNAIIRSEIMSNIRHYTIVLPKYYLVGNIATETGSIKKIKFLDRRELVCKNNYNKENW